MSGTSKSNPARVALDDLQARKAKALEMGGTKKLAKRKADGHLNARERLELLMDNGKFTEFGLLATSHRPEVQHKSAADGKITVFGEVDQRPVAAISNDFTVMGASSSVINGKKMRHLKELPVKRGAPIVFLGESSGARMPDRMGAAGRAILGQDPAEYLRTRETPWVSALLGDCYGSSTWYTCLSDFVVMRRGATMAVASSRVTSIAISQPVDSEDLGGWRLHSGTTGLVDSVVETDEDAIAEIKRFLSYLPSSKHEMPPVAGVPANSSDRGEEILNILPESRSSVYDSREIIKCIFDTDSLLELKPRFGKSIVTGLTRLDGHSVGVIANNPKFKGGAIDVSAMRKATSFLVMCDSFNIPILFLVDQPGFLVGIEGEKRGAPGQIMNWMNALSLCSVPTVTLTMRKNYGQAYLNMGGGRMSDVQASWPSADYGFMEPRLGVNVLYNLREADDPTRFAELTEEIGRDSSAWSLASLYESQAVVDPRETREFLIDVFGVLGARSAQPTGKKLLSNWPTSY
jgi:methylmalonyl-CoA decarboxylase subunit alpha